MKLSQAYRKIVKLHLVMKGTFLPISASVLY